jgi:hypothetical protein
MKLWNESSMIQAQKTNNLLTKQNLSGCRKEGAANSTIVVWEDQVAVMLSKAVGCMLLAKQELQEHTSIPIPK